MVVAAVRGLFSTLYAAKIRRYKLYKLMNSFDPVEHSEVAERSGPQVEQLVTYLSQIFPAVVSDVIGIDVREDLAATIQTSGIVAEFLRLRPILEEGWGIESIGDPHAKTRALFELLDKIFHAALPDIPTGVSAIDWCRGQLCGLVRPVTPFELVGTNFYAYLAGINSLVAQLATSRKLHPAYTFLESLTQRHAAIIFQPGFRIFSEPQFMQLLRGERLPRFDDRSLLIAVYQELSALYEVLSLIPLGLVAILDGETPEIDATTLGAGMIKAARDKRTAVFASRFNRHLRNAIAHGRRQDLPSQQRVRFLDRRNEYVLSPSELLTETREALAVVYALFTTWNHILYACFEGFSWLRSEALAHGNSGGTTG
jgi:hypothetical protein